MAMPIAATVCHAIVIGETNSLRDTEKDFYDQITLEKTNIQAPGFEEVSVSSYKTFCIPVLTARGTHRGAGSVIQLRMAQRRLSVHTKSACTRIWSNQVLLHACMTLYVLF